MLTRPLGDTGIDVSTIGFGTWGLGSWAPGMLSYGVTDDAVSLAALEAGLEHGITFYDTARLYGLGHAETLLGRAFAHKRDQVVIGTKLGYLDFQGTRNYSSAFLEEGLSGSLERLQTEYVDLLMLHDPTIEDLEQTPDVLETLERFRRDGRVRAIGVSTKSPQEAMDMLDRFPFKVVEVNLNMMDLRADECGLTNRAAADGIGLIARTPLCFGFLTGTIPADAVFAETDHRSRWPTAQIRRWSEGATQLLRAASGKNDTEAAENISNALRFCIGRPAVATVIPGMMRPEEIPANADAGRLGPLPAAVMEAITETYAGIDLFSR